MLYQKNYFSALTGNLSTRSERAAQGLLSLGNPQLRQFLHDQLTAAPGTPGAWLADPVFEPTFGWQESSETMSSLAGGNLLHRRLAEAMAAPPKEPHDLAEEYAFPSNRHPFTHQLAAWEILNRPEPQSLVVTSGTGSGKTECFLVPVLSQLAKEIDAGEDPEGVRALFIYPLNALINSQQNRLDAWTHGFGGQIRHCLYTGALENERRNRDQQYDGQAIDRKSLRASPPQLLVTNATMLEYMLIRKDDEPILQKSAGKLRWIILDEAHTHIGSQAAEMALLLRRVMLAFQVKPQDVRFVATSATFGSDTQTIESLRTFLADIGGVDPQQVHVVQGHRDIPALLNATLVAEQDTPEAIGAIEADQEQSALRYQRLEASPTARRLRALFMPNGQVKPQSLQGLIRESGLPSAQVLAWLDLLSGTKSAEGLSFLPLRAHLFHNVIPAIRACVDRNCSHKAGTALAHADWPFGMVYLEERTHCRCGAPLMPLVSCEECNESFLQAATKSSSSALVDPTQQQDDEFALEDEATEADDQTKDKDTVSSIQILITNRAVKKGSADFLDRATHRLTPNRPADGGIELQLFRTAKNECPCCGANIQGRSLLRPARIGTPFTLSTVIGTLLEFCPPDPMPTGKPFQGRKLISFTDSRQGTARIAVKLQQDSERNRIRGLIYQRLLQAQPVNGLSAEDLQDLQDLQTAERLSRIEQKHLQSLLDMQAEAAKGAEISWTDMANHLGGTPELQMGMLDYYNNLAPNTFGPQGSVALANMLLAREFYRRPKRANSLETLGLVQVCYPKLDSITSKPMAWPKHLDVDTWRTYLKVLLDFFVRENTLLNIDKRWQSLIGARISPKWVVAPVLGEKPEKLQSRFARWPSVNTVSSLQSRAILLLCKAFNWSTAAHQDQIDSILSEAWRY